MYPHLPKDEPTPTPPRNLDRSRNTESPSFYQRQKQGHDTPINLNRGRETESPMPDQYESETNEEDYTDESHNRSAATPGKKPMVPLEAQKIPPKEKKSPNLNWTYKEVSFIVAVLIAILVGFFITFSESETSSESEPNFDCPQLSELWLEFPEMPKRLFKSLRSGVESFQEGETSVFSFFSTDEKIMKDLMNRVVGLTQNCLQSQHDPVRLGANDISRQRIEDYRNRLNRSSIMVIDNLNRAPVDEVPVLHSVCDTENPLVKPSVIFITMKVSSAPGNGVKHVDFIINYLNSIWGTLTENVRTPLIARIVDQTFFVKP